MVRDIIQIVNDHEKWRSYDCINLIPSENITSPQVRAILSCDMGHRYTLPFKGKIHGSFAENAYRGTKFMDEVEEECRKLACKVYHAKFACVKPLSGHISAMVSLIGTMKKNSMLLATGAEYGGYDGYGKDYFADILGYKSRDLPFDADKWQIDVKKTRALIEKSNPQDVVLGASFILFPYDLKTIKSSCKSAHSNLLYDASHVFGLIAGNQFQPNPLANGVDLLYGSTHKSFFGPQGGIIVTNNGDLFDKIEKNITWRTMDNAHWNRIAALAQAFLEIEKFGVDYAGQVVKNARCFGKSLSENGFPIKYSEFGYTSSHQLAIDQQKILKMYNLDINGLAKLLEKNNIITDAVGRIGINEITRLGMKTSDMNRLTEIVIDAIKNRKDVRDDVRSFRKEFDIAYCFN